MLQVTNQSVPMEKDEGGTNTSGNYEIHLLSLILILFPSHVPPPSFLSYARHGRKIEFTLCVMTTTYIQTC